jgi:inhibitor of KinA sporulation pathway (predicted exonuclease)
MGRPPRGITEVIEIGAYKLDEFGTVLDVFSKFVQPEVNPILSGFCRKLTSISQENVNRADKFPKVIDQFFDFCEVGFEDYVLCAWGPADKRLLTSNCKLHKMDFYWLDEHINIKKQYHRMKGNSVERGLKAVTKVEGFEFSGIQHRAVSDAQNLAKIVAKYIDEWVF